MSRIETIAIKDGNSFRMINADNFDPDKHEKYVEDAVGKTSVGTTTLATVNVDVGITPELQEVIDETKAECLKVAEENSQLKQKIETLEKASGDSSELISENSRLKDAVTLADNATKAAEGKVVSIQAEFDAFKNDVAAMHARIAELEASKVTEALPEETVSTDFESWKVEELKQYLASKDIGYKPTATKPELLKLIPKD